MQEFFLGGCSGDDYAAFIKFNTGSQDKCSVSIKICPFNSYNSISNQLFQLHFFYLIIHSRPTAALKKAVSFTDLRKIRLKELTATSSSLNPSNYYFLSIPSISQTIFFFYFSEPFRAYVNHCNLRGGPKREVKDIQPNEGRPKREVDFRFFGEKC